MSGTKTSEERSTHRLRWIGYALLILSILDAIQLLIPPGSVPNPLTNPLWQFQTIGNLIERIPVPLLGLALIFYGDDTDRTEIEEILLKILSWATLLVAIISFLVVPLLGVNTMRINSFQQTQISQQEANRSNQLNQFEEQIKSIETAQLTTIAQQIENSDVQELLRENRNITVDSAQPEEFRNQLLKEVTEAKKNLPAQTESIRVDRRISLLKNAIKWIAGALIAGVLFLYIWRGTRWARFS